MPSQTLEPTNGTDGRVENADNGDYLAGVTNWKITKPVGTTPILHFESQADLKGTLWPNRLKGVGGDWKVSLEGITNLNATDQTETGRTGLSDGLYVNLNVWVSKENELGYPGCKGWVENFQTGQKIGNDACTFTCDIAGDGPPPAFGAVT